MDQITTGLHKFLANSYALYLKTHNYHWNVAGSHFKGLHELFEEQYNDLAEAVDEIAERIRALDVKVPASFSKFDELSELKEGDENFGEKEMIAELAKDNKTLSQMALDLVKICQDRGDEGTADMLIARSLVHDKSAWMLKAHLA